MKKLTNDEVIYRFKKIHGSFWQEPKNHWKGHHCFKCKKPKNNLMTDAVISKFKKIHKDKYDYSKIIYKNTRTDVEIICPEHGSFFQTPANHFNGHGCKQCSLKNKTSIGEQKIEDILIKYNILFKREYSFNNLKMIRKLFFDFYLPELNTIIEFDGRQHYEPISFFGGENEYLKLKKYDTIKNEYCKSNKITLLRIKYNDIKNIEKILINEGIICQTINQAL
jgi:very-short-patch-repair endonuclease